MTDRRRTDWLPFLLVLLSLATPSQGGAAQYLEASEVLSADMEPPVSGRRLEDLFEDNVSVDLDLGEGIEDRILVLHPPAGETREFMTEQRFETSLTVSAEGPHLDLLDWKHHYSPWRRIRHLGRNRFLTSPIGPSESAKFPKVTSEEIRAAVLKAGGTEWAELVRNVRTPNDSPLSVGVSTVSFRIMVREGGTWKVIKTLHFRVPMGC